MNSVTFATSTYGRVRADIIGCLLAPGLRLRIRDLCERYGVSLSPMREALNRLSSENLVVLHDQRGFSVSDVSVTALHELTRTRIWLNETGLRHSIQNGDTAWEEQVVLAYHRLTRVPRFDQTGNLNADWEAPHRAFHLSLTAACGSRWLEAYCEQLLDQSERYRNLSRSIIQAQRHDRDEHRDIFEAVIARNADRAVALMTAHVSLTSEILVEHWDQVARIVADGRNSSR
jgi:GntR family transcriptional regulator, carbon starvation induced regulator